HRREGAACEYQRFVVLSSKGENEDAIRPEPQFWSGAAFSNDPSVSRRPRRANGPAHSGRGPDPSGPSQSSTRRFDGSSSEAVRTPPSAPLEARRERGEMG